MLTGHSKALASKPSNQIAPDVMMCFSTDTDNCILGRVKLSISPSWSALIDFICERVNCSISFDAA